MVLPVIWFGIIGLAVMMYVLMDGFVMGMGILAPFAEDDQQLDLMMNTAAPVWDGNETWLVLGGTGLFAAFPKAYALMLSALYLPVLLMLGAIVEGLPLEGGKFSGAAFAWFSPFAMLTGTAVVFGYALLGSTWLILKTEAATQNIAYALTRPLVAVVVAFMGLVSASLPFLNSQIMARWFQHWNFLWLSPVPVLAVINAILLWRAVMRRAEVAPFILALTFFGLGFVGLLIGMWPNLLPPSLSIWDAAAPPASQKFVLVGTLVILPAVFGYTWWSYKVFAGKVTAQAGYH